MNRMYNTEFTEHPVCPHCGHETEETELELRDGDVEFLTCENCDQQFKVECYVTVAYCTDKVEKII